MDIKVRTEQVINGVSITNRQLEALQEILRTGSMSSAAKAMGVSVPVVHRYVSNIEAAAGEPVTKSTPMGTRLTPAGKRIVDLFMACEARCRDNRGFTVACSPVTEELMMSVFSSLKMTNVELVVSDDKHNVRMMIEGLADMALVDDPLYLFDIDEYGYEADEIGYMGMVYVDNGPSFIRYKYGAQRVAFMFLDTANRQYTIDAETYSLSEMLGSNKSFFVDEYLLTRKGLKLKSAVNPKMLRHSITAVYRSDNKTVRRIITALKSRHIE
ncbi:MAG: LysR family transcriptional regulator [archaeon]|nr:LysR family transcriptional regulator [archaeon]